MVSSATPASAASRILSSLELAGCMLAARGAGIQAKSGLGFAQLDPITYVHLASPSREAQMN